MDLISKFLVVVRWVQAGKVLNQCDLSVLIILVQRQNTRTGRCDPSVQRLMYDTEYCERSVSASLKKLEKIGAIKRVVDAVARNALGDLTFAAC